MTSQRLWFPIFICIMIIVACNGNEDDVDEDANKKGDLSYLEDDFSNTKVELIPGSRTDNAWLVLDKT